jgi:hypothetical protein
MNGSININDLRKNTTFIYKDLGYTVEDILGDAEKKVAEQEIPENLYSGYNEYIDELQELYLQEQEYNQFPNLDYDYNIK